MRPTAIAVDGDGNVLIADEGRIKIFDPGGRPLQIIGQAGGGPGEFIMVRGLQIGPRGHLAAIDLLWECNVYDPQGAFQQRIRYRTDPQLADYIKANSFSFTRLDAVVPLDDDLFLLDIYGLDPTREERHIASEQLLLAGPDSLREIVQYPSRTTVRTTPGNNVIVDLQGELLWAVIGTDELVYTHAYHDVTSDPDPARYRLHRISLTGRSREVHSRSTNTGSISIPFERIRVPDACRILEPWYNEFLESWYPEPAEDELLRQTRFYPSLKALRADGSLLFGFRYCETDTARAADEATVERRPRPVDVIDLETGVLKARAEFPFIPDMIRNGRAYRLYTPADGYPAVFIYRLDERLYRDPGQGDASRTGR